MLPSSRPRSSTRGSRTGWKLEDVRRAKLKTTADGVLRNRHERQLLEASKTLQAVPNKDFHDCTPGFVSKEPVFEALPELSESHENFSIRDDNLTTSTIPRPDFSTYNFWTYEPDSLFFASGHSDTISSSEDVAMPYRCPDLTQDSSSSYPYLFPVVHVPNLEHSMNVSVVESEVAHSTCNWDLPEFEEDMFRCTLDCNVAGVDEREDGLIDDYLDQSSPQFFTDVDTPDLGRDVLVYAGNQFAEEPCFFQSSAAPETKEKPGVDYLSDEYWEEDKRDLPKTCFEDGRSTVRPSFHKTVSSPCLANVQGDVAKIPCQNADRVQDACHLSSRHSPFNMQSSKLLRVSPSSSDLTSLTTHLSRKRRARNSNQKTVSVQVLLRPKYSSDSPAKMDNNDLHKSSRMPERNSSSEQKLKSVESSQDVMLEYADHQIPKVPSKLNYSKVTVEKIETPTTSILSTNSLFPVRRKRTDLQFRGSPKMCSNPKKADADCESTDPMALKKSPCHSSVVRQILTKLTEPPKIKKSRTVTSPWKSRFPGKFVSGMTSQKLGESNSARSIQRVRRLPLPQRSVEILQDWLNENLSNPYPSRDEKDELFSQTGLKMSQIENWLGNARQKLKIHNSISVSDSSPEQSKKRSKRKRCYPLKMRLQ